MPTERFEFLGAEEQKLAARLDIPAGETRAYALFAHCFTGGKDILAASRIGQALAACGIAVLRFDFTGLGGSEGEFANTNFSSNLTDLIAAANYLRQAYRAPSLLIGHSLGGSAVLAAASKIPEVRGVVTIGAPSDPAHVKEQFRAHLDEIQSNGEAEVKLGGRPF
ncbi:alpha/beta hydrolase family protein [Undibacterium arcticum]